MFGIGIREGGLSNIVSLLVAPAVAAGPERAVRFEESVAFTPPG
jgi:hypothetical protein